LHPHRGATRPESAGPAPGVCGRRRAQRGPRFCRPGTGPGGEPPAPGDLPNIARPSPLVPPAAQAVSAPTAPSPAPDLRHRPAAGSVDPQAAPPEAPLLPPEFSRAPPDPRKYLAERNRPKEARSGGRAPTRACNYLALQYEATRLLPRKTSWPATNDPDLPTWVTCDNPT